MRIGSRRAQDRYDTLAPSAGESVTFPAAAWLIPALHGWPRTTINGIWLLVVLALYVDLAVSYRRQRKAARDPVQ
jgi:hypothetical protein